MLLKLSFFEVSSAGGIEIVKEGVNLWCLDSSILSQQRFKGPRN